MQPADASTVLGDFDDATFTYDGVTTTFFRRDDGFWVRTDGPDGELRDYEIAYTFGVEPLQQFLIAFPDGRHQALSICWDARPADAGGQRWFHLYPGEDVDHRDILHWTGPLQNWNFMCADCHSTNLERGYRRAEDRYETTYSEVDVSCEACHGPGSRHVAWAEAGASPEDDPGLAVRLKSDGAAWVFDAETGTARRDGPPPSRAEVETCGRCHVRRGAALGEHTHGRPLADAFRVALLDERLYHADGQIDDEVYVYGSFLQSKMYREGMTCGDCHDPHSARLHADGNAVCARCHLPPTFDTPAHHHHPVDGPGTRCVDCHMAAKSYMVVDPRRDHSFRVPRPDLSLEIGTPNACTGCHDDRDDRWAADVVASWYGPERADAFHYGEALAAGRSWRPDARELLLRAVDDPETPGIARATALELLARYPAPEVCAALARAVGDGEALVRRAATGALEACGPEEALRLAWPRLADPMRTVRLEAARVLAATPARLVTAEQRPALQLALEEYRDAQLAQADRAEAHLNLGWLALQRGDEAAAEAAFETAIRKQPRTSFGYVNLADLYRGQGRDEEGEQLLRRALEEQPESGELHHALGLLLVRRQRLDEAVDALAKAVELRPAEPRYAYVHGVALQSAGDVDRAVEALAEAHERFPAHRELLYALATMYRDRGERAVAAEYARRLVEQMPHDPGARQLLESL